MCVTDDPVIFFRKGKIFFLSQSALIGMIPRGELKHMKGLEHPSEGPWGCSSVRTECGDVYYSNSYKLFCESKIFFPESVTTHRGDTQK